MNVDTYLLRLLLNRNGHHFDADPIADDVAYVFFSDGKLYRRDRLGTRRRLGLILLGRRTRRLPLPLYLFGVCNEIELVLIDLIQCI